MDSTLQNPQSIDLRKTFSRIVYFIDQMNQGKSRPAVLRELEFTEAEFQLLLDSIHYISMLRDNDANILFPGGEIPFGGISIYQSEKKLLTL
jgi:hypothetical protein